MIGYGQTGVRAGGGSIEPIARWILRWAVRALGPSLTTSEAGSAVNAQPVLHFESIKFESSDELGVGIHHSLRDARRGPPTRGAPGAVTGAARRGRLPRRRRLLRSSDLSVRSPHGLGGTHVQPPHLRNLRRQMDRVNEPRQRHGEGHQAGQGRRGPNTPGGPLAVPGVR